MEESPSLQVLDVGEMVVIVAEGVRACFHSDWEEKPYKKKHEIDAAAADKSVKVHGSKPSQILAIFSIRGGQMSLHNDPSVLADVTAQGSVCSQFLYTECPLLTAGEDATRPDIQTRSISVLCSLP